MVFYMDTCTFLKYRFLYEHNNENAQLGVIQSIKFRFVTQKYIQCMSTIDIVSDCDAELSSHRLWAIPKSKSSSEIGNLSTGTFAAIKVSLVKLRYLTGCLQK